MAIARDASPASASTFLPNNTSVTLLRLLAVEPIAWPEIAQVCSRDPFLSWLVLGSQPLDRRQLDRELCSELEERLARLGAELLRAWLLLNRGGADSTRSHHHAFGRSLLVAELAMHMAIEVKYRSPQDAYLAGLWHDLASQRDGMRPADKQDRARQAMFSARMAASAHPSPPVLDAIQLQGALEEHISHSHTLVRLLWVALQLAGFEQPPNLANLSRICRLPESALLALRADVAYLAHDAMHANAAPGETASLSDASQCGAVTLDDPWLGTAARACIQTAFTGLGEGESGIRLTAACRLLCATDGPRLIFEQNRNQLAPLLTGTFDAHWLEGIELSTEDETSNLGLALRTNSTTHYHPTRNGPGRSTIDWELDRWLGGEGFKSLPWQSDGRRGVAVFEQHAADGDAPRDLLLSELVGAAAGEILRNRRLAAERLALQDTAVQGLNMRLRRIRHEVNNPLTIIRNYLDLLRQRYPADQLLDNDLNVLGSEIDRVGIMLASLAGKEKTADEPAFCDANESLHHLRSICEEALFKTKGIHLELRTARGLPKVAILPSALHQIVLNLLRNASEALSHGNKVFVSTTGPLNVEGKNCVEMRFIDNGPGMQADRLRGLFSEPGSDKGGGHEGIGLSIVRDILREIGGYILCRSNPGAGTAIQLFIPVHN